MMKKQLITHLYLVLSGFVVLGLALGCTSAEEAAGPAEKQAIDPEPSAGDPPTNEPVSDPVSDPELDPPVQQVDDPSDDQSTEPPSDPADQAQEPILGGLGSGEPAELLPPPPEAASRQRKRMDIDQLDAAIQRVTGGIGWTKNGKNQFEELARTLGKPDYVDLTTKDMEPSALFQKFLDDAARSACSGLMTKELQVTPEERVLFVHVTPEDTWKTQPEQVVMNLLYLLERYHGKVLSNTSPQLEPWRWLFESAEHVAKDPLVAWQVVCVGLITHPGFYTY